MIDKAKFVKIATILLETIQEATTDGVFNGAPSGHCYAGLMSHINIDEYQFILNALKRAELIEEHNHLLTCTKKGLETKTRKAAV